MGLCSHTVLLCRWRGHAASVRSSYGWLRSRGPESTRSSIQHVRKDSLKWRRSKGLACATWTILERWIFIKRRALRSRSSPRSLPIWRQTLVGIGDHAIGRSEPFVHLRRYRTVARTRGRTPRSRSDRTAIAARSSRDRGAIAAESTPQGPDGIFVRMCSEIDAQSTHDQATIVVDCGRSRRKAWPVGNGIHGEIKANSWPISKRQRRPKESLSRPCKTAPTTASTAHDFGPISLFKSMYFPSLFFNFWSIREGIKRISRKILSSSWFPRV